MSQRPNVIVGAVVTKNEHVLLIRRKIVHGAGSWTAPAGHLEFEETPVTCAIRETYEETGINIRNLKLKTVTNTIFQKDEKHYVTLWMECEYISGDAIINDPSEVDAVGWFPWDALPVPLFAPFEDYLKQKESISSTHQSIMLPEFALL